MKRHFPLTQATRRCSAHSQCPLSWPQTSLPWAHGASPAGACLVRHTKAEPGSPAENRRRAGTSSGKLGRVLTYEWKIWDAAFIFIKTKRKTPTPPDGKVKQILGNFQRCGKELWSHSSEQTTQAELWVYLHIRNLVTQGKRAFPIVLFDSFLLIFCTSRGHIISLLDVKGKKCKSGPLNAS